MFETTEINDCLSFALSVLEETTKEKLSEIQKIKSLKQKIENHLSLLSQIKKSLKLQKLEEKELIKQLAPIKEEIKNSQILLLEKNSYLEGYVNDETLVKNLSLYQTKFSGYEEQKKKRYLID